MIACLEKPTVLNDAGIVSLAEAVILQAVSDLWDENKKEESIEFFKGEGFLKYADLSGMSMSDRRRLLSMLNEPLKREGAQSEDKVRCRPAPSVSTKPTTTENRYHPHPQTVRRARSHGQLHI